MCCARQQMGFRDSEGVQQFSPFVLGPRQRTASARRVNQLENFERVQPEGPAQNLALTVLYVLRSTADVISPCDGCRTHSIIRPEAQTAYRFRAERENLQRCQEVQPESQGQHLALTVLHVLRSTADGISRFDRNPIVFMVYFRQRTAIERMWHI